MERATNSFPVPVSPVISTDTLVTAILATTSRRRRISGLANTAGMPRKV